MMLELVRKQVLNSNLIYKNFNCFQLQETQETTNQVRQSAAKLSNKMRETRDRLEDDLEEARGVVKDLKDFLSGADCPQVYSHRDVPHWLD